MPATPNRHMNKNKAKGSLEGNKKRKAESVGGEDEKCQNTTGVHSIVKQLLGKSKKSESLFHPLNTTKFSLSQLGCIILS